MVIEQTAAGWCGWWNGCGTGGYGNGASWGDGTSGRWRSDFGVEYRVKNGVGLFCKKSKRFRMRLRIKVTFESV